MSCYNWESGSVKFPTSAWSAFKKIIQNGMAKAMAEDYLLACKLYEEIVKQKKGKRNFNTANALEVEISQVFSDNSRFSYNASLKKYNFKFIDEYAVCRFILGGDKKSFFKPIKKDFPIPNSSTYNFSVDECSLQLDNLTKTLHWHTGENNHQVEHAHKTDLAKLMMLGLSKVTWTRATGGVFIGNDEYNKDSEYEGGGGNYVTSRFGPLGEPHFHVFPKKKRSVKK
jgi:hypothetical protein